MSKAAEATAGDHAGRSETIERYYSLTKPGVMYGNVITAVAGLLLGVGHFRTYDVGLWVALIVGMTLVIASACVLNNVLDQDIDRIMERTKGRAVAAGAIPGAHATIFSIVLGVVGIAVLALWVNWLVVGIGVFGFVVYVWLYGAFSKRKSIHGTLVGSISGAMPILGGYCAVSGRIDAAAILVFLVLFFWQFPEFYSIAIYRKKEYAAANVPVMTVVKGIKNTTIQIFVYTGLFVIASVLLTPFGYTGWTYFSIMLVLGAYWINMAWNGLKTDDSDTWARRMFHFSLVMLLVLSAMLAIGPWLP
ncbi:MAG TPA: heme o synthase [Candidatus Saccharimonadales bacterium]|nr:heme o synthase [Candidatus Saccharimonadales bacterium]